MKNIHLFLYLIVILLVNSCASFKKEKFSENQVYLTDENLELINGTYKHNENNNPSPLDYFWGSFYKTREYDSVYKLTNKQKEPYFIKLKVIDKNKINVELKVKGKVFKTYDIKGRVKNGFFQQNRKTFAIPAILYNSYHSSKFRIGYLKDQNIVTDYKKIEFGTYYFIIPFIDNEEIYKLQAERIK